LKVAGFGRVKLSGCNAFPRRSNSRKVLIITLHFVVKEAKLQCKTKRDLDASVRDIWTVVLDADVGVWNLRRKMERKKYDLSRTQLRLGEEQIVVRLEL
jgi:hypothetical protein